MSPAAGVSPLRVGPEDVTAAEAGELVKDVGIHNHAKALIQATAKQMPKELRSAIQRFEYTDRSKHLDPDEVLYQAQSTVGSEAIERILSARIKGSKTNPFESNVIVLYETPDQRTARCAILYNPNTFPKSVEAFDAAMREGKIVLPGELSDRGDLREALDQAHAENARLAREIRGGGRRGGRGTRVPAPKSSPPLSTDPQPGIAPEDVPEGVVPGETPGWPIVNDVILDLPDEVREKLAAAELEPEDTEVELPEGVEAGDPGWPVDEETGELLVLPDSVREKLAAAAEEVPSVEREPVDLTEFELPEGNADQIIGMVPFLSSNVLGAIVKRDERSTVRKAAAEELAERPDSPIPVEEL